MVNTQQIIISLMYVQASDLMVDKFTNALSNFEFEKFVIKLESAT